MTKIIKENNKTSKFGFEKTNKKTRKESRFFQKENNKSA